MSGRKRKSGPRQPNGQPARCRATQEREAKSVVIAYRRGALGRSEADATQPEAESVIGRLCQDGALWPFKSPERGARNAKLLEAADYYAKTRMAALRAIPEIRKLRSGADFDKSGGYDSSDGTDPAYVANCRRAIAVNDELRMAIQKHASWQGVVAVDLTVWGGYQPREMEHLRNGLAAIRKFMDMGVS